MLEVLSFSLLGRAADDCGVFRLLADGGAVPVGAGGYWRLEDLSLSASPVSIRGQDPAGGEAVPTVCAE